VSERELVQKILSWIERTDQENRQDGTSGMWEHRMVDRYLVLTEDIEKLCKERLNALSEVGEEQLSGHFPVMCTGVGPELVHIPANTSIQPTDIEGLWEIVKQVAERDSTYEYAAGHNCPYCDSFLHSISAPGETFLHEQDCIVTKARQLMEWRRQQPRIKVTVTMDGGGYCNAPLPKNGDVSESGMEGNTANE